MMSHIPCIAVVIHGGWGDWYPSAGGCSVTCGVGGVQRFERKCDNPRPQNGGSQCSGDDFKYEPCNTHCCPGMTRKQFGKNKKCSGN